MSVFFINSFLGAADGDFESIATITVGSGGASSIDFTNIPGTYQHLQIRIMSRASDASNVRMRARANGDTGNNYAIHLIYGNGSSVPAAAAASTDRTLASSESNSTFTASVFSCHIIDILDYAFTTKTTTFRMLSGSDYNGSGEIVLASGLWTSTSALTSLNFYYDSGNFVQHSTAALYGIKAAP